ncbi:MAG: YunC family protein [Methanolinea sp.]|nr:YunC family protein [Methanolinea sp.]
METERVPLRNSAGEGFVIPLGPVNLVGVVAKKGMVGCGAVDVAALDRFGYPAARVRPSSGPSISSVGDLLAGIVKEANESARRLGVREGMTGKEALDILS